MQLPLPFDRPPQPRRVRPENRRFYEHVRALRRAGHRVWRAGPGHTLVNGQRMANAAVLALRN